jgi:hypothetical protein
VKSAIILLKADVRDAAAKMFAEPVRDGVADAVEAGAVDVVALPQAAARSAKQATATTYRALSEIFICGPPMSERAGPVERRRCCRHRPGQNEEWNLLD